MRAIPQQTSGMKANIKLRPASSAYRATRGVACKAISVRPYTLRQGDTLSSIAEKRDIDLNQLIKLNHEIDVNNVRADQTILVPVGKLSERDRMILDGMGKGKYRTYPIRKGEKLSDVLSKRNISLKEFEDLNPGVDPDRIQDNMIINLPRNKYTAREREMLTGAGVPMEFFGSDDFGIFGAGLAVGAAVYAAVSYAISKHRDD